MDKRRLALGAALILLSVVLFFIPSFKISLLDKKGESYFQENLKKLAATYAVVRGLNAGISVIKDSEIDIAPGGVGATIAAGEIVDPIDDIVERFSYIILISIISLGIQKTVLIIGVDIFFKLFSAGLAVLGVYILTGKKLFYILSLKVIFLSVLVRFFLPISAIFSDISYNTLFRENVEIARNNISELIQLLKTEEISLQEENSVIGKIKNIQKSFQIEKKLQIIKDYSSKIIDSIIILSIAFVFQNILIPIFVVWLFIKSAQWIVRFQV
ncbi:hypothetical protein SAMN06265182_1636 [Persephonella hydrogeniphila]|uniref:Uncharacterized protein n=1 Tax=Persephonella hydrogeniphila TaxID=198703 RepID=A0A285NLN0_9AQUI|nr:hypothetical protein [Persephonella hydrogeniphila]SNZ09857.1 hypothetical protein SAMN06265182_1636 [Persephonella hydrogeniphila]